MNWSEDSSKEFICRQCSTFLGVEDLVDGKCPNCDTDEDIFTNDIEDENDEMLLSGE